MLRPALKFFKQKIREAILSFYDPAAHTFGNGTHDSLALATGVFENDPQEKRLLAASLAKYYVDNGHEFDGGFMSYNIYPELSRAGYVDDALKMLVNDSYPGPARSIKKHDATTYWEMYIKEPITQRQRGLDFYAFAHPTGWMVTDLAGIRFDSKIPGGQRLILEPQVPMREKLDWVEGEMKTQ
ncbi:MAG: hypothetical protein JXM70_22785, partial [Pirellulales bacterium]|nr:hypothetical protein [Pirellulales bacterium]